MSNYFLDQFDIIVACFPNHVAIRDCGKPLSYTALAEKVKELGSSLQQSGVKKGDVMGVCFNKSADHIIAMLACWYAGAAFVPIDPRLPPERRNYILQDADLHSVLCDEVYASYFENNTTMAQKPAQIVPRVPAEDALLAYMIYTSGTSGKPKGVLVPHEGLTNVLNAQIAAFGLTEQSKSLFYLATSFDASISDIGTALLSGAELCIEPDDRTKTVEGLINVLNERRITYIDIPPSILSIIPADSALSSVKTMVIGGEPAPIHVVQHWSQKVNLFNVYGPTEVSICTSLSRCTSQWDKPLIGSTIPNITYHILGLDGKEVAVGEQGELVITGKGLALGYNNRPALTQAKFVIHDGVRAYRTGDLVLKMEKGAIQFIGRLDRQLKCNGILIAPEELESHLVKLSGIHQAVVVKQSHAGVDALIAFITPANSNTAELKEQVRLKVPEWMVPSQIIAIEHMPKTVTGKIDFLALEKKYPINTLSVATSNGNVSLEKSILSLWQNSLGIVTLGVNDNFFELGGNSIKGMLFLSTIKQLYNVSINYTEFNEKPIISAVVQ